MRSLGTSWAPFLLWLAMGALTAAGALCYAELSTRFPRAGGAYVFLREGFGLRCAFVYGWMALLVMDPGITAALGIGFAQYFLETIGASSRWTPVTAIVAILVFGFVATRGLGANMRVLRWTAATKLAIVGILVLAGISKFLGGAAVVHSNAAVTLGPQALAGAIIAAFFAFGGWWDLGRMSEEVESPRRTMPPALVGGVFLVTAIYALVTLTFVLVAPASIPESDAAFVSSAGAALFGSAAGRLLAAMVTVTVAGSLAAVLLGAPRTYFAMSRDGLLPLRATWFDEQRGTAPAGTLVQVVLACTLVSLGSFDQILGYFVPCAVFFLGLSAASLFVLDRPPVTSTAFRVPLYPVPLVLFLALVVVMVLLFIGGQPFQTLLGAAVVLVGLVASRLVM